MYRYVLPFSFAETANMVTVKAMSHKTEFFTSAVVSEIIRHLLGHYFLLSADDLQTWDADPEEYCTFCSLLIIPVPAG